MGWERMEHRWSDNWESANNHSLLVFDDEMQLVPDYPIYHNGVYRRCFAYDAHHTYYILVDADIYLIRDENSETAEEIALVSGESIDTENQYGIPDAELVFFDNSDPRVATLEGSVLTARKPGKTVITELYANGRFRVWSVTVKMTFWQKIVRYLLFGWLFHYPY